MEVLVEVPVPVKVPVPVPYPAPYPHPYPAPTSPHPTLVHHGSPTPQYVPTTPRLQVFPHPESALPHIHSTTVRPLFTGSPHPTFQSSTPHPTAHTPIPTIHHHQSHSPSPRSFLHSPAPTGQPLTSTATPAHIITATPRIDSDVLDPARAALVEKFNTQLQQRTKDKELSRRKRGVVFPDEANPSKVERHQRKAAPQDRLRPNAPQILGGTVNLAGPRRPNFLLHSVDFYSITLS